MNTTKPAPECRTYSAAETARILGIGKSTLTDHVRKGTAKHLRPIRVGDALRFPMAVIDDLAGGAA